MHAAPSPHSGVYIHIPFCLKKCPYCDFYSITDLDMIFSFIEAVEKEMGVIDAPPTEVDSVYLGGGTPSILDACDIQRLLDRACDRFRTAADIEITIEANPGTVTGEKLKGYKRAGINRISIGVQSFHDGLLGFLGRIHRADEGVDAFNMARDAGFENIGIDLMFGLPGQTVAMWGDDLETATRLSPEHLSCYMLTYEPGTRMATDLKKRAFTPLSDRAVGDLFDFTGRFLEDNGYCRYEVSNFSTSVHTRSRHNLKYWSRAPYIGLGPSAHSFIDNRRSWNVGSVDTYLERIDAGRLPVAGHEVLDIRQQMIEAVFLGLRCAAGIRVEEFENRFRIDFTRLFGEVSLFYESKGYLISGDGYCRLTPGGMRFADGIARGFIDKL
jgi:oxygen-independent coproporphyrinogen-3 oxidase